MTDRILSAVHACLDWAEGAGPAVDLDADALLFLLTAHFDAGSPDPGDWCTADVHDIARTVRDWDGVPDGLRDTWLTWCDYLVDHGLLLGSENPRKLRAAIAAVDLTPGAHPAGSDEPAEDCALPFLDRLGVSETGDPEPMRPVASSAPKELDTAARACALLTDAARLASWAGAARDLHAESDRDELTAADTAEAAHALGVSPARVHALFDVARHAGLLRTTYTRVLAGRSARAWADAAPGAVADAWADALLTMTGLRGMTAFLVLTDLFVCGDTRTPAQLLGVYGRGLVLGARARDPEQHVLHVLEVLDALGAARRPSEGGFRITRLGDHFMVRQLRHSGADVSVTPPVELMDAEHVLTLLERGRPVDTEGLLDRWVFHRGPQAAARALLEASADPAAWHRRERVATVLAALGADLSPVLRLYVHHPVLGGWARRLRGTHTEPPTSHQVVWAVLDSYAILLDSGQPLPHRDRDRYAECAEQLTRTMWLTGHPAADTVLDQLADGALGPPLAEAARRVRPVSC